VLIIIREAERKDLPDILNIYNDAILNISGKIFNISGKSLRSASLIY